MSSVISLGVRQGASPLKSIPDRCSQSGLARRPIHNPQTAAVCFFLLYSFSIFSIGQCPVTSPPSPQSVVASQRGCSDLPRVLTSIPSGSFLYQYSALARTPQLRPHSLLFRAATQTRQATTLRKPSKKRVKKVCDNGNL